MAILITRPEPGATRTANRLRAMHFSPFILPLSKTYSLQVNESRLICDVVIATSEAVFLHSEKNLLNKLCEKVLYCVGTRTAEAAQMAGFKNIAYIARDIFDLVQSLDCAANTRLLYLAGRIRRPDLENMLETKFPNINILEVYDTKPIILNEQQKAQIPDKIEAVMLYSAMAATGLTQIEQYMNESTVLLCLSTRIANAIPKAILSVPVIAYEPNEEAMLNGLKVILG